MQGKENFFMIAIRFLEILNFFICVIMQVADAMLAEGTWFS